MASEQETGLDTIESLKSELEKRSLELVTIIRTDNG